MTNSRSSFCLRTLVLLLGLFMLQSCNRKIEADIVDHKSRVQVNVSPFYFAVEDMAPATRGALSDAATRLSFAVFDSEGEQVESVICQESSAAGFGSIDIELFPGNYMLVAVAHNGAADAVISSASSVTLPGTTFTDTFAEVEDITVESGKDCDVTMNLPRVTSAFILRLTDTPPADAKEIKVVVNTGGTEPNSLGVDPTTGLALNNWRQTRTIPVADLSKDIPIYFIKLFEQTVVNIKATAYDTEGEEIISHTIPNVPLNPNQKTIATGCFFKSQASNTFTVESIWSSTNKEISY